MRRGVILSEEGVEEWSGYFDGDAVWKLRIEGAGRLLKRSREEDLGVRRSAEGGDVFDCEIKVGLFDLKLKECPEALFQNPKMIFI